MGLGDRFDQWLRSTAWGKKIKELVDRYNVKQAEMLPDLKSGIKRAIETGDIYSILFYSWAWIAYVFAGGGLWLPASLKKFQDQTVGEFEKFQVDPSLYLAGKIDEAVKSKGVQEMVEVVGSAITQPVLTLFEHYATVENPDVHEFSRAFHGYMISLGWAGGIVDAGLKSALGTRAPKVGDALNSMYWSLGLGFLGWQTLAPLLSAGLQPNLERYYNKLYRPTRFTPSQVRDLFALGKITGDQMRDFMREQGWRDTDISTWIDLSYRTLSEGAMWELYHKGEVDKPAMDKFIRAQGYNPVDIPLLYKANEKDDTDDAPKFLASTAKKSFKDGLIAEPEFREILDGMGYAPREIDLQVALLTTEKATETRELSTGQIKQLYDARILGKDESIHNLVQLDYAADVASKLIELWDKQSVPKAVRINRGTITEAYFWGVLSRNEAKSMLRSESGYDDKQAELLLKLEDAQLENKDNPALTSAPAISISMLNQFAQNGLMTREEILSRAELAGFSDADRLVIVNNMFLVQPLEPLAIDESVLLEAYLFGLLSREELAERLTLRGIVADEVELLIRTFELENPLVFGEFTPAYLRQPNPSQMQLALQRGLIDEQQFRDRLTAQGYSPDAVEIYLFNAQYQAPVDPKNLTKAEIIKLYNGGNISRQNALQRLLILGYTAPDAQLLIAVENNLPQDTEIGQAYLGGFIEVGNAIILLGDLGFSLEEIENFLNLAEEGLL